MFEDFLKEVIKCNKKPCIIFSHMLKPYYSGKPWSVYISYFDVT